MNEIINDKTKINQEKNSSNELTFVRIGRQLPSACPEAGCF